MLTPQRVDAQSIGPTASRPPYRSSAFLRALEHLDRYARHDVPILIEGESGTGKTALARRVHDQSPRAAKAFREVVLSGVADSLAESELFGHEVGSFTGATSRRTGAFASASGGTLFLDEIGKASLSVQTRLLVPIEARRIHHVGGDRDVMLDIRIVAATSVPLAKLVEAGLFLPDLYARIEAFRVRIPPLRERREDIHDLVIESVRKHAAMFGHRAPPSVEPALMSALRNAPWPNNLRQLDAAVHRLLVDADAEGADTLTLAMFADAYPDLCAASRPSKSLDDARVAEVLRESLTREEAARKLGYSRSTLWRHLKRQKPGGEGQPAP